MNPYAILFVLALAGPLDNKDYRVRQHAAQALERVPAVDALSSVVELSCSPSAEVAEAAGRWLAKQGDLYVVQAIDYAMTGPLAEKPWRRLGEIEKAHDEDGRFRDKWWPVVDAALKAKYGQYSQRYFYAASEDGVTFTKTPHMAGNIFYLRAYGQAGTNHDWRDW